MVGTTCAKDIDCPAWMFWKRRCYVVAWMMFLGFVNMYFLRANLSVTIVAMTEGWEDTLLNGTVIHIPGEFDWDSALQGWLLSSFYYGYITTQLLGGWLATRIGGNTVFGFGIAASAFLTLIVPFVVRWNVYLFLSVRIIAGICEGVSFPSIYAVWARWAPPLERTILSTIGLSGCYIGIMVAMPTCGILTQHFGWESTFYIFGTLGLIWYVCWIWIVKESPDLDPHISKEELCYIKESLGDFADIKRHIKHPWKSIFTSVPFWAIIVSYFCQNWGFYTILTQIPKFLKDTLGFDLTKSSFMSAVPYIALAIMLQCSGYLADWLQVKGYMTTTQVRRSFICAPFLIQSAFLLGTVYFRTPVTCMICLIISVGISAFTWCGISVNHLDIAPQHASVLMGISTIFGTLPGMLSPMISGYIVTTHSVDEWRIVFYIACGMNLFGCIIYGIFCSAKLQPWAIGTQTLKQQNTVNFKEQDNNNTFFSDNV